MRRGERYVSDNECNWGRKGNCSKGIPVGKNKKQKKGDGGSLLFHCLVAKMSELTVGQLGATESSQV